MAEVLTVLAAFVDGVGGTKSSCKVILVEASAPSIAASQDWMAVAYLDVDVDLVKEGTILSRTMGTASKIPELAQTAPAQFLSQNPAELARLFKMLLSNGSFDRGSLSVSWVKPFDPLAQGTKTGIGWVLGTIFELGSCKKGSLIRASVMQGVGLSILALLDYATDPIAGSTVRASRG
jgi:hypothetical protein